MSYEAVIEEVKTLPQEYLILVSNYITSLKKSENKNLSVKGMLSNYANPSLIEDEKKAFVNGMVERYEKSLAD